MGDKHFRIIHQFIKHLVYLVTKEEHFMQIVQKIIYKNVISHITLMVIQEDGNVIIKIQIILVNYIMNVVLVGSMVEVKGLNGNLYPVFKWKFKKKCMIFQIFMIDCHEEEIMIMMMRERRS